MAELPFYEVDQYRHLRNTLGSFGVSSFRNAAFDLFYALGYATKKQLPDLSLTPKTLTSVFQCPRHLDEERAIIGDWESIDFLFQFTQEDLYQDSQHHHGENGISSFLFFAIDLKKKNYSLQQLEDVTHAINYCFVTPVIILYRYGKHIALGMAKKRPNKLFSDLDVVEAVEVVNDIIYALPHRQHMSFLHSFNFMTMSWHADHRTLIELYQYWWMQFQSFSYIKETVSRKDTSSLLDYYFDDLRKFPLLTEEEEFWCLLRVKPKHYTVDDPNNVPRYRYSAFLLGFFDEFIPLFHEFINHWTDIEVPGHILLQTILSDVLTL